MQSKDKLSGNQSLGDSILNTTIDVFNEKGMKFTMDDIAKSLSISKKTIYTVFTDKNELMFAMVDYVFDSIKAAENKIILDDSIDLREKIKRVLGVMPEGYRDIDFSKLFILKDKYPKLYEKVEERLENGWEATIKLIEEGMQKGIVRNVSIPIIKMMLEASLEQFFQRDILIRNDMTYQEGLSKVVEIITEGMLISD